MKLARQYFVEIGQPGRGNVIARRQSYHGNTLGALAAGGNAWRRAPYAPLLSHAFSHVSPAFAYREQRDHETEAEFTARLAAELEAEFQRLGPDTVAAFVAEPVVGATAGCVTAPAGYFQAVRTVCDRHGALLILDEVMCGMGRTGTLHAWEREGIAPDIQTIAKGLGGGYQPISALLACAKVVDAIRQGSGAFQHGHTYLAHPVACAAATSATSAGANCSRASNSLPTAPPRPRSTRRSSCTPGSRLPPSPAAWPATPRAAPSTARKDFDALKRAPRRDSRPGLLQAVEQTVRARHHPRVRQLVGLPSAPEQQQERRRGYKRNQAPAIGVVEDQHRKRVPMHARHLQNKRVEGEHSKNRERRCKQQ